MNYCPIIKSKALKKGIKQGQISSFPSLFNSRPSSLKPRGMDVVSYVLTKASSCPPVDTATVSTQHPVSHRRPSVRARDFSSCSGHPSRYLLTYRPSCLASPLLPNHYDTLSGRQSGFQRERRRQSGRRAPRWTGGRREGGKVRHYASFSGW